MTNVDRELARLNKTMDMQVRVMAALYQAMQVRESDKIPNEWEPTTMNLSSAHTLNIVPRNRNRQSVSIQNQGPSNVILSFKDFDGPYYTELLATYPLNLTIDAALLSAGASFNVNTKGPIFGYAVGYGTTNPNSVLTIVQTIFAVPTSPTPPYVAGMQNQGILENEEEMAGMGPLR